MAKSEHAHIRRAHRVIRMVSELHRMGFQRLRFMPYFAPLAYRIQIASIAHFAVANGCYVKGEVGVIKGEIGVTYSASSPDTDNDYFGWTDAKSDGARELAIKFADRFPEIVKSGLGRDWAYAGWLVELIGAIERFPNRIPVLFSDDFWEEPHKMRSLPLQLHHYEDHSDNASRIVVVPLPPPGERAYD
jgi:hypothetical protein